VGLLSGKTALITGAGRGQGRAHAVALASEGANIVAVDIGHGIESVPYALATEEDLARTAEEVTRAGGSIVTAAADVRDQASLAAAVDAALARFGAIDICVANAGIFSVAPIWDMSEQQWTQMIDVNLSGVWRTAKAVLPHMIERRRGSLVLIASVNALEPGAGTGHYTSAKHGVIGLCRSIALEAAAYGVRCNAICPGSVDTEMLRWPEMYNWLSGKESGGTYLDLRKAGARYHALAPADVMPPDDISGAVLFLSSDLARSVTGIALPVDRGHLILPKTNQNRASYADGLE
jgi:SDR family mycofactocin-dependent oxidoreductase